MGMATSPHLFIIMKNRDTIINEIIKLEERMAILKERSYNLEVNSSEHKEITKRKKKLEKNRAKLFKKLGHHEPS